MFSKKRLFIGTVIVMILAGFLLGQAVNAAIGSPGDQNDPLVTKSYIDTEVSKLQGQLDDISDEADTFRAEINDLRDEIEKLK